jgi:sigma-B regulation protein RsbU (phosphoserine phosphatase)
MRLAPRMALLIVLGAGVVLAAIRYSDYRNARKLLEEIEAELRGRALLLAVATAREIEIVQRTVENVVGELAVALESGVFDSADTYELLEGTLGEHEEIYGSAVALLSRGGAPEGADAKGKGVEIPYVYRDGAGILRKDLASGGYPFETKEWFKGPRERGGPIWTEPYYDEGGGDSLMVTYSMPIESNTDGRILGVVTGDLALDWLEGVLGKAERSMEDEGGKILVVSPKGTFVAHWMKDLVLRESVFTLAERSNRPELRRIGQEMTAGRSGLAEFSGVIDPEPRWLAYTPIPGTGWSLGIVFEKERIAARLLELAQSTFPLAGLGAIAMVAVALLIAHSISRPIRELEAAARTLAAGDLEAKLPEPRGSDEIARLAESFSRMRDDLRSYIDNLKETTAAKARIEGDLKTARTIQLDLLPSRFTFEPPRPEIDVRAWLEPARDVGGDFYDFFLLGPDRLFVAVADVSGKGVPAALFMAVSKAYLKAFAKDSGDPARALSELNDELALENDEAMFLTVFCAVVDLRTGEGRYASGGHHPPLLLRASGPLEELPKLWGPLVGLERGATFESGTFRLERGDVLVGSSDGVEDAGNERGELYGTERAEAALEVLRGRDSSAIIEALREDIRKFVGEAAPTDDITLLALRYLG